MSNSSKSFHARIDWPAVRELEARSLPEPIDALNLVSFADEVSYRWYGLLLAPRLLVLGVRPVWVATREKVVLGEMGADEMVIIEYPNHRLLLKAVTGRYYRLVNRLREKGVRWLEFSLTKRLRITPDLKRSSRFLVAQFNAPEREKDPLIAVAEILESGPSRLVYASRELATLSVFHPMLPSDPNPPRYNQTAVFTIPEVEAPAALPDDRQISRLKEAAPGLSLQLYRRLTNWEAMPWSRRRMGQTV